MAATSRATTAFLGLLVAFLLFPAAVFAQEPVTTGPGDEGVGMDLVGAAEAAVQPGNLSTSLTVLFLLTILTLAPAILVMMTSFTRIIVVFGFLRQAMATQQSPPNQVLVGLALFLTFFIMYPTWEQMNEEAIQPYINGEIATTQEALDLAVGPIRDFMFRQLGERPRDVALFIEIANLEPPATRDDIPTHVLIPAFILNEMRIAFQLGFIIYIPFLIIDMVVASTLMAMGMMMLPPVFVSLPFKIILFVLADGWYLLVRSLVQSFF